jgi:hypothetical protein
MFVAHQNKVCRLVVNLTLIGYLQTPNNAKAGNFRTRIFIRPLNSNILLEKVLMLPEGTLTK